MEIHTAMNTRSPRHLDSPAVVVTPRRLKFKVAQEVFFFFFLNWFLLFSDFCQLVGGASLLQPKGKAKQKTFQLSRSAFFFSRHANR